MIANCYAGDSYLSARLRALSLVESNDNHKAVGRDGERTAYQVSRGVWKKYLPKIPFKEPYTSNPKLANYVAINHINYIKFYYMVHNVKMNDQQLYAIWNMGISGYEKHKSQLPAKVIERCKRFDRLVKIYNKQH